MIYYSLAIGAQSNMVETISAILGVIPNKNLDWRYEVIEKETDPYFDFINYFLNLLEGKYDLLLKIGIQKNDITIWMIYEYDQQCNIEFLPQDMKRIGESGIVLCISCYQKEPS